MIKIKPKIILKPYEVKDRIMLHCLDKTRTKQSMRDECDINVIVKQYVKTGTVDYVNPLGGQYGDNPSVTFTEAMNIVRDAQSMFDGIPSKIRAEFNNRPEEFLDFMSDPGNQDEMIELGLLPRKPPQAVDLVPAGLVDKQPDKGSKMSEPEKSVID